MDHYQLTRFELKDTGANNAVVLVTGSLRYKAILQRAFNPFYFSRTFEDRFGRFEWGTYIYNIGLPERAQVEALLRVFQDAVCIEDDLTETFALGYHTQMDPGKGYARTSLGSLVYQAKPYRGDWTSNRKKSSRCAGDPDASIHPDAFFVCARRNCAGDAAFQGRRPQSTCVFG